MNCPKTTYIQIPSSGDPADFLENSPYLKEEVLDTETSYGEGTEFAVYTYTGKAELVTTHKLVETKEGPKTKGKK